jgi:hypothetical protein
MPALTAASLMLAAAALRLLHLDAMEFKRDEEEALTLAIDFVTGRRWSSAALWPTHGLTSSNGVANAPLFTWIAGAFWSIANNPVGVAAAIALTNAVCLLPLWRWARHRMDERRALLTLAICAVSPFPVLFSRKIWTQDLLLPGVVALLWGVEWLRGARPWRGIAMLALAVLLVGQLHQAGAIGIALLPIAIGVQAAFDARHRPGRTWARPSAAEAIALAIVVALNLFFWLPYGRYLAQLPSGVLANRPTLEAFSPALLLRVGGQIMPLDLFTFVDPRRDDLLRGIVRPALYAIAVILGAPLFAYGLWRWLRAPLSIPVFGIWWWCVIAAFTLTRIPGHPAYVLALTPLPALLAAGAFDPPHNASIARALTAWRIAYIVSLALVTVTTLTWLNDRGGASGDYGVAYNRRMAQATSIVARRHHQTRTPATALGELPSSAPGLTCAPAMFEVPWLVHWLEGGNTDEQIPITVCDAWTEDGGRRVYRWTIGD